MMSKMETKQTRFIKRPSDGAIFIRKEDVVDMIRDMAGTEETDTRNRWEELAANLNKLGVS